MLPYCSGRGAKCHCYFDGNPQENHWKGSLAMDTLGMLVGLLLTLFIFSYILGDNALFRIAIHIFVGVTTGYVAMAVTNSVIIPQLILPLRDGNLGDLLIRLIPLVLSGLLLFKIF